MGDKHLRGKSLTVNGNATFHSGISIKKADENASGSVELYDNDALNKLTLQAPATLGADYTLTLPINDGDEDQVLSTNGSGVLSWATASSGASGDLTEVKSILKTVLKWV